MEGKQQRLAGKVAIITSAGSGIGEAAARAFAREGGSVVLVGRREEPLRANVAVIEGAGGKALALAGDVSKAVDVDAIVAGTMERFCRLDILFNNAGVQGTTVPTVDMEEAAFDDVIAINLKGPWLLARAALRRMIAAGHCGVIVGTSSFLSTAVAPGFAAYSASKAGLEAMTRTLALEAGPHGSASTRSTPA